MKEIRLMTAEERLELIRTGMDAFDQETFLAAMVQEATWMLRKMVKDWPGDRYEIQDVIGWLDGTEVP